MRVALRVPRRRQQSLAERIEARGPTAHAPVPSWQFDRGRFENYLGERNHEAGIDLFGATRVHMTSRSAIPIG